MVLWGETRHTHRLGDSVTGPVCVKGNLCPTISVLVLWDQESVRRDDVVLSHLPTVVQLQ